MLAAFNRLCDRGFTMPQKLLITAGVVLYVLSPLDVIPDLFLGLGWLDDAFVLNLLRKVWMSPTLPRPDGGQVASVPASVRPPVPHQHVNAAPGRLSRGGVR